MLDENRRNKFLNSEQRMNLLYQWVKTGAVTLKEFMQLIELKDQFEKEEIAFDDEYDEY